MTVGVMRTFTGRMVNVADPDESTIHIDDIAHHLSIIGRWGGSAKRHYSVAEHSCWVSWIAEEICPGAGLHGLLHDAHEAYVGDIITPLKKLISPKRAELASQIYDISLDYSNNPSELRDRILDTLPPDYNEICDGLDAAIYDALDVESPTHEQKVAVHMADQYAAWVEAQVLTKHPEQCRWTIKPPDNLGEPRLMADQVAQGCTPAMAEGKFHEIWAHHIARKASKNSA